jgi:hypothetical protein
MAQLFPTTSHARTHARARAHTHNTHTHTRTHTHTHMRTVRLGDWYQWPHVVQFSSWSDLRTVIDNTDWRTVSAKMLAHNNGTYTRVQQQFMDLLELRA